MSARIEVRALRVPCDIIGIEDAWEFCEAHHNDKEFDYGTYPDFHYPHFRSGLAAEREYLDYVLSEKVVTAPDYFTEHRDLTDAEQKKYLPVFRRLFPDLEAAAVRYVHFCYYDGADAPDVYD